MIWPYANRASDAELDPTALVQFVDAAVRQFYDNERSEFFTALSGIVGQYDNPLDGNGSGDNGSFAPSMNQQANMVRRNGNNGDTAHRMMTGDRRPAMDGGSEFLQRFPEARHISCNPFGRH